MKIPRNSLDRLSDNEIMAIAAEGAHSLDRRELESALRHSLRSPPKECKPGHFAKLTSYNKSPKTFNSAQRSLNPSDA
jgi:hypothetical protein